MLQELPAPHGVLVSLCALLQFLAAMNCALPISKSSTEPCKALSAFSQHVALRMAGANAVFTQMMSCAPVTQHSLQEAGSCTGHWLHSRDEGEEPCLPASVVSQNPPGLAKLLMLCSLLPIVLYRSAIV